MFARRHFEVDLIQISRGSGKLATGGLLRQLIMSIFGMSPTKKPESTEADYLRIHGNGDEIGNFVRCCVPLKQGARGLVAESDGIWCTKLDSILHAIHSSADHVVSCSPNRSQQDQDATSSGLIERSASTWAVDGKSHRSPDKGHFRHLFPACGSIFWRCRAILVA